MKILITGGSSAIGQTLIKVLDSRGNQVIDLSDKSKFTWRLGQELPVINNLDFLVHLAHDRSFNQSQNIAAAEKICESYAGKKIFLSSLSAHSNSKSTYGKSKYSCESIFLQNNSVILRAGIVYGLQSTGIVSRLANYLKKNYFFPVPYRGIPTFYMTHLDDLINEIITCLTSSHYGTFFCADLTPISLGKLLESISQIEKLNNKFFELPIQPFDSTLKILSKIFPKSQTIDSLLSISHEASNYEIQKLLKPQTKFKSYQSWLCSETITSAI